MVSGISKEKYWVKYKRPCLEYLTDLKHKEYPNYKQSLHSKIHQLEKQYLQEKDKLKKMALKDVITALKMLK